MHFQFFILIFIHHAWMKDVDAIIAPPVIHNVKIIDPVPVENVKGRSTLNLYCNVSGDSAASLQWYFNGKRFQKDVPFSGVKGDSVRHTINGNFLNITNVRGENSEEPGKMYDSGRYRCIATNEAGSVFVEKNIKINVMGYFKPNARSDQAASRLAVIVGRPYSISCPPHVTGYGTTYSWGIVRRDIGMIPRIEPSFPSFANDHSFVTNDGKFVFAVVLNDDIRQSADFGGFVCILQNAEFGLSVYSNPHLLWKYYERFDHTAPNIVAKVPVSMAATIGTTYKVTCGATGFPVPKNRWFYQGKEVKLKYSTATATNIEYVDIRANGYQLVIHKVTKSSEIRCVAESSMGSQYSTGKLTAQIPTFWQHKFPESINLSLESSLTLTCNASGVPTPTYEWFQNSIKLTSSTDGRKTITDDRSNGVSYLKIKKSNVNDHGVYTCVSQNDLQTLTQSVFVKVNKVAPPVIHSIKIIDPVPVENVKGRSTLSLYCDVSGNSAASLQWSFNGKKFQKDVPFSGVKGDPVRHTINGNFLNITNVRGENSEEPGKMYDSGRYRCIATNEAGSAFVEKNIKINVMGYFRPSSRIGQQVSFVSVAVGRPYSMACPPHVTGHGTTYSWGIVSSDNNMMPRVEARFPLLPNNHSFVTNDGKLVFATVLRDDIMQSIDVGGFVCILQNLEYALFAYSNHQMLKYFGDMPESKKPQIVAKVPDSMVATVGTTYRVTCGATGYPIPKIKWFYQGTELKRLYSSASMTNIEFVDIRASGYQLVIHRVTKSGEIRCVAENPFGSQISMGKLTAQIPTFWQQKFPESINLSLESTLALACNASGVPRPTYEWFKDNIKLISSTDGRKTITYDRGNGVSYLKIKNSNVNDHGVYTCVSRNDLETLTQSVFVKVNKGRTFHQADFILWK